MASGTADPAAEAEVPEPTPTPTIRILLPDDQQEVVGRLHRRWQAANGQWFYTVSVSLWSYVPAGRAGHR